MNNTLNRILKFPQSCADVIAKHLPLFLTILAMLCLPTLFPEMFERLRIAVFISAMIRSVCMAMILTVFAARSRAARAVIFSLLAVLLFVETYCYMHHLTRFNSSMMHLILQSNPSETSEYLSAFVLSWNTLKALLVVAAVMLVGFGLQWMWQKFVCKGYDKMPGWAKAAIAIAAVAVFGFSIGDTVSFTRPATLGQLLSSGQFWGVIVTFIVVCGISLLPRKAMRPTALTLAVAVLCVCEYPYFLEGIKDQEYPDRACNTCQQIAYNLRMADLSRYDEAQLIASSRDAVVDAPADIDFKIVLIVGESYSKPHSSLYGYCLDTNPLLAAQRDKGNLFTFTDCITRQPSTEYTLKEAFSTWTTGDTAKWESAPLFPALFKKAGLKTALIDNHGTRVANDKWTLNASAFYSSAEMNRLCFDHRNDFISEFDGDLINATFADADSADLVIYHLMGQHISAFRRFPHQLTKFTTADYADRENLNDHQCQVVADYDNATLYNDLVVNDILEHFSDDNTIIIYMSDHGEEIYDFRDQYGRTQAGPSSEVLPLLYDVPYMVWMSDRFMAEHPEVVERVKQATDFPIVNSAVSHVLLGLAGIKTPGYRPDLDWLNAAYDTTAVRQLYDGSIYENYKK